MRDTEPVQVGLNASSEGLRLPPQDARVPGLRSIDDVAKSFGIRASALRYYEERGLVAPRSRHGGRRWYGSAEVRRIGAIRFWQQNGRLSLDEIAEILDEQRSRTWAEIMRHRIDELDQQIEGLSAARSALEHILEHHPVTSPDGCPHYEELVAIRGSGAAG